MHHIKYKLSLTYIINYSKHSTMSVPLHDACMYANRTLVVIEEQFWRVVQ